MKICFVIGTLQYSGAEKIMSKLIEQLSIKGYDISVILLGSENKTQNFQYIKQYPSLTKGNVIERVVNRYSIIKKIVESNSFDLVVSFGSVNNINVATALMFSKTPFVLCERNDPVFDPIRKIHRLQRLLVYPFAKGYIFQTEEIKKFFSNSMQKRSFVIPNFVLTKENECQTLKPRRKVIATSARLDDNQKNQVMLIEAFAEFAKTNEEYQLEVYGDGPDESKYRSLIDKLGMANRIKLMGYVDDPTKHIKTADIFVLPSRFEGMPNALIEAMAIGLPCIATNCSGGGSAALVRNKVNGILIPNNDKEALIKAFVELTNDEFLKTNIGKEAYRINDDLNMDKIIEMWETAFKKFAV